MAGRRRMLLFAQALLVGVAIVVLATITIMVARELRSALVGAIAAGFTLLFLIVLRVSISSPR